MVVIASPITVMVAVVVAIAVTVAFHIEVNYPLVADPAIEVPIVALHPQATLDPIRVLAVAPDLDIARPSIAAVSRYCSLAITLGVVFIVTGIGARNDHQAGDQDDYADNNLIVH
jgi:hypothetical protein